MERENKKYSLELTERASKKDYKDRVNVSIDTFTSPCRALYGRVD